MHLITQTVHVSLAVIRPWTVIMGPTECCTTILLPKLPQNLHRVSLLSQVFRNVGFLRCSSWCKGTAWRTIHLTISRVRFQLSRLQVLWSWHHHLLIRALLSVIRGLALAALPWMLDLWSSRRTAFVETGSSGRIFSYGVTCVAVVLWFFEMILLSVRRYLSGSADFRPLFLFADIVFP
jgi:hypothetical protein